MGGQNKELEREFFDQFDHEHGYDRFDDVSYEKIFNLVQAHVSPQAGEKVVDMGCGTGIFSKKISEGLPGLDILGIDISPRCISRASKLYPQLHFQVGDVENTGLPSNSIDIVFFFGVLHHFPDFGKVAAEARRILKSGGRFFSLDPHHYNPAFWLYRSHSSPFYSPVGVTPNERLLTRSELKRVMEENGFQVESTLLSGIRFTMAGCGPFKKMLGRIYNLLDGLLGLTPLTSIIGAWVVGWGRVPNK